VITEPEDVIPTLTELLKDLRARGKRFAEKGKESLRDWNATQPDKLPYIVLVFDELGEILLDDQYGKKVEILLSRFASKIRSVGGILVICTQSPRTDIVTGRLKVNISGRICFGVPMGYDSRTVLDAVGAEELREQGRALYRQGADLVEVQVPFLGPDVLKEMLAEIISRDVVPQKTSVALEEILLYGIKHLDGKLSHTILLNEFGPRGLSEPQLMRMLKEAVDRPIILNGNVYRIPPIRRGQVRRIVAVRQSVAQSILKAGKAAVTVENDEAEIASD
jgi:DNA segregation ATPase FtsK/SpoIIIE-like protein